jgi:hypothetical protein
MMENDGWQYVTAHFINNERTQCEIEWVHTETGEPLTSVCEAGDHDDIWKELMTIIDIDTLHEQTYKYIKAQNEAFEQEVISIAKRRGMLFNVDSINSDLYKTLAQLIFSEFNADTDKEKLFMLKLQLFELDDIKSSSNREAKAALRKAPTMLAAIRHAIDVVEESRSTATED